MKSNQTWLQPAVHLQEKDNVTQMETLVWVLLVVPLLVLLRLLYRRQLVCGVSPGVTTGNAGALARPNNANNANGACDTQETGNLQEEKGG